MTSSLSLTNFEDVVFAAPNFKPPTKEELYAELDEYNNVEESIEYVNELISKQEMTFNEEADYKDYIFSIMNNKEIKQRDKGYHVQHKDFNKYYVNYISDVKLRSKDKLPQIQNIQKFICNTIEDKIVIEGKKGEKEVIHNSNNKYFDFNSQTIESMLDKGFYELLPYESFNAYGCSFVKTCFNTIGKEYEYVHPFIDYDLDSSTNDLFYELSTLFNVIQFMACNILRLNNQFAAAVSIIGYTNSSQNDYRNTFDKLFSNHSNSIFTPDSYVYIQSKPKASKFLSVHVVFYNIKIHISELKARIFNPDNMRYLSQFKAFDVAPYRSGSLRHIGSIKAGLVNEEDAINKRVINLSSEEILEQLITYHNKFINYQYIHLDLNNVHCDPSRCYIQSIYSSKIKNHEFEISIIYGGQQINQYQIESVINQIFQKTGENNNMSYSNRWSFLAKYVMYKHAIHSLITDENINFILPGHTSVKTQITFFEQSLSKVANPKPLLNYLKELEYISNNGICTLDFTITDKLSERYIIPAKFGTHKIEDLSKCKNYKDVIDVITGSCAISSDNKYHYFCLDGIQEFNPKTGLSAYIDKYYPSKLCKIITYEDLPQETEADFNENPDAKLSTLFYKRLLQSQDSKKKQQLLLKPTLFMEVLKSRLERYNEDAMTAFKLNGYSVDKVKPEVLEDVKKIIKLFEDRLVDGCKSETDNTLQEFLRSIKYLLTRGEKPEKGFIAIDKYGATGKSLFFSKIIKDLFGLAGLNDDSLSFMDSNFSDAYSYLYTVLNEVSKGKHSLEDIASKLKQMTDNSINGARVKCVQKKKIFKNIGLYVILSNSDDLNGGLDYTSSALMSRYVLIEFKPFVNKDNQVDTLAGGDYYSLIDKYKVFNDPYYTFSYDFRNALFKYILDLDISTRTAGRAQPSKYKDEKYQELALDSLENTELSLLQDQIFTVDYSKPNEPVLDVYSPNAKLVGFKRNDLCRKKELMNKILRLINYKSAISIRRRYKLSDSLKEKYSDNKLTLIICELSDLKEYVEIKEPQPINNINFNM